MDLTIVPSPCFQLAHTALIGCGRPTPREWREPNAQRRRRTPPNPPYLRETPYGCKVVLLCSVCWFMVTRWCPSSLAKLVNITPICLWFMVMGFINQLITGGHHPVPSGKRTGCYIEAMAIESSLIYPSKMVIFHSYVNLPEGTNNDQKS